MISSTIFTLLSIAIVSVSAAPSRRGLGCSPVGLGVGGNSYGELRFFSNYQAIRYNETQLPAKGLLLTNTPNIASKTVLAATTGSHTLFEFESCNSEYLGYKTIKSTTDTVYYGHLAPANYDTIEGCLGVHIKQPDPQVVSQRTCSYTDDVSQLEQFWSLLVPTNRTEPMLLHFLGSVNSATEKAGYYSFKPAIIDGKTVVEAIYEDALNYQSSYDIHVTF